MTAFIRMLALLVPLLLTALSSAAFAHSASTSYLSIDAADAASNADAPSFSWTLALRDVDALLDLDADGDGRLRWAEVADRAADIEALAQRSLQFAAGGPCVLRLAPMQWQLIDDSGYLRLSGRVDCAPSSAPLQLAYRLFEGVDATHRALLRVAGDDRPQSLPPGATVALTAGAAAADTGFVRMLADGARHILGGLDHLLFLVALMLPAVMTREQGRWVARAHLHAALLQVAWIATAFTVAHSITLGLASFGLVRVPARVIEPLIAATVLATALNNLWPVLTTRLALAAFGFGLIHGFGFAEVLAPLGLPTGELARALLAFNLGVEVGQLVIVGASFALLAALRHWRGYPRWVLAGGSAALVLLATLWLVERTAGVALLGA
jgi:hypothetical protein